MTLQITITEEKDTAIVELAGKVDSFSAAELEEGFKHVKETGKQEIILLLKDLEYIDSRGIGAFLSFFKAVKDGGGMVLLAEAPPNIMELFNVLGVEDLAEVYPSLEQALEHSRGQGSTEEVQRDAEEGYKKHLPPRGAPSPHKAPYVLVGAAVLIAAILVFLFLKPAKRTLGTESELGPKLELLERRLARIESRLDAPSSSDEELERLSRGFSERFSLIEKDLGRIREDLASLEKKAAEAVIPEKEKAPQAPPPAYHIVSRGETLYRIGLLYNVTVEELRRLNDLRPDQPLLVGQRLRVRAP